MKLISKLFCLLALVGTFASCDKDYDLPPLSEPTYVLPADAKTTSIAELRQTYKAATQDTPMVINDNIWLRARVSANDISGNIFKTLYIQDNTGGIAMQIDQTGLFSEYPVGQELLISLKGLCISVYGDQYQIGSTASDKNRIIESILTSHVHKNGWAQPDKVQIIDVKDFKEMQSNEKCLFNLIRISNVYFKDGGKKMFAPEAEKDKGQGVNRDLIDITNNMLITRNSAYAKFASKMLPVGRGTVVAIASKFRDTWQLVIPEYKDVYDFTGKPVDGNEEQGGGTVTPDQPAGFPYSVTFDQPGNEKAWTIENVSGDFSPVWKFWKHTTGNHMQASAHEGGKDGKNHAVVALFISPEFNLTNVKEASLVIDQAAPFFGSEENVKKYTSVEAQVEGSTEWVKLAADKLPTGTNFDRVKSTYNISKLLGKKVKFALRYSSSDKEAGSWKIYSFALTGEKGANPDAGKEEGGKQEGGKEEGGSVTPQGDVLYNQDFASNVKVEKNVEATNSKGEKFMTYPSILDFQKNLTTPATIEVSYKFLQIRNFSVLNRNCIWFTKGQDNWIDFKDLPTAGAENVNVTLSVGANLFKDSETCNLNAFSVEVDGKTYELPSKEVANKDSNAYDLSVKVPVKGEKFTLRIKVAKERNTVGVRLFGVKVAKA